MSEEFIASLEEKAEFHRKEKNKALLALSLYKNFLRKIEGSMPEQLAKELKEVRKKETELLLTT